MLRLGQTAAQVGGHVRLGNLVAAGALAGVEAGHQPALQQVERGAGADVAGLPEVVAAHGIGIGRQQRVDLLCQPVLRKWFVRSWSDSPWMKFGPGETVSARQDS